MAQPARRPNRNTPASLLVQGEHGMFNEGRRRRNPAHWRHSLGRGRIQGRGGLAQRSCRCCWASQAPIPTRRLLPPPYSACKHHPSLGPLSPAPHRHRVLWSPGSNQLLIGDIQAIVFSFQHDRFGRVTQFHFDGRSLVLRQSRLLDFRSDEPTTDAYHMIRWMANRPMGETRFRKAAEEELEEPGLRDVDKSSSQLPVEVQGT